MDNKEKRVIKDMPPEDDSLILKSRIAALEQLIEVYEKSVTEKSEALYAEITRNKEIEEALRINRLRLVEAMDLARIVYWELDNEKRLLIFNDAFYAFLGTNAEKEGGYLMSPEDYAKRFIYPDDLPGFFQHNQKIDARREREFLADLEHRVVYADGQVRYILARSMVLKDADYKVTRIYGANQDVTERRQIEEDLSHSVSLLNSTLESTADGILVVDRSGRMVMFNNKFMEMWRIPADVMKTKDDNQALAFVLNQLSNPEEFMSKVREAYTQPEAESFNELHFKDGRLFERYSRPQYLGKEIVGRVWSFRDVTEQKRTEEALRESEERLRAIFHSVQAGILLVDAKTHTISDVNDAAISLIGVRREEILGRLCHAFICPAERGACPITDLGQIIDNSERILLASEGEEIPVLKSVEPITLAGRPYLIESFVDLRDRKRMENELRVLNERLGATIEERTRQLVEVQAELMRKEVDETLKENAHFLQMLIDTIPNPIFYKDSSGIYQGCNKAFESYIGLNKSQIIGKSAYDIAPKELADRYHEMDLALFQQGGVQTYEAAVRYADGSHHDVIFNKATCLNSNGSMSGLVGVILDITQRKQTENALKKSYALLKGVVESPKGVVIFALDREYRYIVFNQNHYHTMNRIWGVDIALGINMLDYIKYPEDRQKVKKNFDRALAGESFTLIEEYGGTELERRYYEDIYNPIFDEKGDVMGLTLFLADITERIHIEKALKSLNNELERKVIERTNQLIQAQEELVRKEKLATLGQLAGIVGHEIRNPLGVMNNAVYFLKTVLSDADDNVKEYLDIIKQEIDKSLRTITDLLDFSRTRTPHIMEVLVESLLNQTIKRCMIPENISVSINIPANLPTIQVDPHHIEQVFQNLITNAVQAMPKGGSLRISARVDGAIEKIEHKSGKTENNLLNKSKSPPAGNESRFVEITISDTGIGIPHENMKKLFQPLFTTKAKGIGLGLVACKNLVEANAGKIGIISREGEGTIVILALPVELTDVTRT